MTVQETKLQLQDKRHAAILRRICVGRPLTERLSISWVTGSTFSSGVFFYKFKIDIAI